jgi:hypothetical protein
MNKASPAGDKTDDGAKKSTTKLGPTYYAEHMSCLA